MRLTNLQAVRGIACLLVVGLHLANAEAVLSKKTSNVCEVLQPFAYCGMAGVDLFFVLSGFVTIWANWDGLGDRGRAAGYIGRRVWRIMPLYWICWFAAAGMISHAFLLPLPADGWELACRLLLISNADHFLPQAWTLSFEMMFYLIFAVFFLLPRRAFLPALGLWIAAIIGTWTAADRGTELVASALHPFVVEFLLGCIAGFVVRRSPRWCISCLAAGVIGFVTCGFGQYAGLIDDRHGAASRILGFGSSSVFIVYGAAGIERVHGWRLPRWLQITGDASYAIYLSHLPVLTVLSWATIWLDWRHDRFWSHLGWLFSLAVPTLAAGWILHYAVEMPLLNLLRPRRKLAEPIILRFPAIHERAKYRRRAA